MKKPHGPWRIALGAVLLATALVVPLGFWFATGWAEVGRAKMAIAADAERSRTEEEAALAGRLSARLSHFADAESKRPYYHYQNLFHDPDSADLGASIVPSPLASGPEEPLISTYFQIDQAGGISIPTFNAELPERNPAGGEAKARGILEELAPGKESILEVAAAGNWGMADAARSQVVTIGNGSYAQNLDANQIYATLKNNQIPRTEGAPGQVVITLGTLRYAVVPARDGPVIAAVRSVDTPKGRLTQGFVLSTEAMGTFLPLPEGARLVVEASAEDGRRDGEVRIGLAGGSLRVETRPVDGAVVEAAQSKLGRAFASRFALVASLATLAAVALFVLFLETERLGRQRSRFAISAAHELRTPLAGLRMYGEMLAGELGDPARTKTYASRVADEAARLGRVVDNVLGVSQLERGSLRVRPERGDLAAAVRDEVARIRPSMQARGAELVADIEDGDWDLAFDRDALARILENLVDNAEKYGREAEDRSIRVSLHTTGAFVEMRVADRGPGIERGLARRLFSPFVRAERADAPAGLGLGLALGRALARAHGGDLRAEETEGGGATFVFSLPRRA